MRHTCGKKSYGKYNPMNGGGKLLALKTPGHLDPAADPIIQEFDHIFTGCALKEIQTE